MLGWGLKKANYVYAHMMKRLDEAIFYLLFYLFFYLSTESKQCFMQPNYRKITGQTSILQQASRCLRRFMPKSSPKTEASYTV